MTSLPQSFHIPDGASLPRLYSPTAEGCAKRRGRDGVEKKEESGGLRSDTPLRVTVRELNSIYLKLTPPQLSFYNSLPPEMHVEYLLMIREENSKATKTHTDSLPSTPPSASVHSPTPPISAPPPHPQDAHGGLYLGLKGDGDDRHDNNNDGDNRAVRSSSEEKGDVRREEGSYTGGGKDAINSSGMNNGVSAGVEMNADENDVDVLPGGGGVNGSDFNELEWEGEGEQINEDRGYSVPW
jgi:hypothetical protein